MTLDRKRTNLLAFPVLTALVLLTLTGCGKPAPGNATGAAAPAVQAKAFRVELVDERPSTKPEDAFAKLLKEAEAGDAGAQFNLGVRYHYGEGVPKDATKAVEWFRKAAKQGLAEAQYILGVRYDYGEGVPKDATTAVEWYRKAAEQGHATAQNNLGVMYYNGEGVPKDATKAVEWYRKAAEQGVADAQFNLGVRYATGDGVAKDAAKAVEWWRKAAEQGDAYAQFNLGRRYDNGEGVPKDATKAVEWYRKAAEQGHATAQNNLGVMYYNGEGVPKDATKAVEWYRKAAEQGVANAQFNLGLMYASGDGVPKDAAKAVEWWRKAAEQGEARAQFNLGVGYNTGEGVARDFVRAYAWFNLAAAQGDENAKKARDIVEVKLTATQRAEGQRLASNWQPGDGLRSAKDSPAVPTPVGPATPIKQYTGTAFAVSTAGHALTNHHVIDGCAAVKVAGREGLVKIITADSVNDLALLQLPGDTRAIARFNPDTTRLHQGQDVVVFGYPLNSLLSAGGNLTPGTLSALTGLGNNTNQMQITAPLQPGSSGSPVLDRQGNVIGVVAMKLDDIKAARATGSIPQNVGFAINGQTVKAFLAANGVPYQTGGGWFAGDKSNVAIADAARQWTLLVECWQ